MLLPRMTAAQRIALPMPATSLIVFQTDAAQGFYYYDGTQWVDFTRTPIGANGYYPGTVFTLAGSGAAGSANGTAASFSDPKGVATDAVGNTSTWQTPSATRSERLLPSA